MHHIDPSSPFTRIVCSAAVVATRRRAMQWAATALAAALWFAAVGAGAAPPQRSSEGPWFKGRLIVRSKPGLPVSAVERAVGERGAQTTRLGGSQLYIVDLPAQASETAVLARLKRNPHLEFAELDALVARDSSNDPYFGSQWHLPKIGASDSWSVSTGSGVTIAILDSGVEPDHPDLKDRLVPGYNFFDGNTNTADVYGHGTKVAGAAAATLNNATGVASVAGAARIMPIRVTGTDGYASVSMLAQGITYAADKGARVANLSFAASGFSSVRSAAQYMKDKGGLVFVSAGNAGKDPGESSTTSLIVVSATDASDVKTSWSNFGNHVHLAAPGAGIYTTAMGKSYASVSGTSFSAPVTAGVAALVMAVNPELLPDEVANILYGTAIDLGTAGKDPYYGHGRVDAAAAVGAALATLPPPPEIGTDSEPPVVSITSPAAGSTVRGLTQVTAEVTDNVDIKRVALRVNGQLVAAKSKAPFAFAWDTTAVDNGIAKIRIRAVDGAGNVTLTPVLKVKVAN